MKSKIVIFTVFLVCMGATMMSKNISQINSTLNDLIALNYAHSEAPGTGVKEEKSNPQTEEGSFVDNYGIEWDYVWKYDKCDAEGTGCPNGKYDSWKQTKK